jgi:hypothetical protein
MSTQLDQIAKKAKSNPKLRFTSLAHLRRGREDYPSVVTHCVYFLRFGKAS